MTPNKADQAYDEILRWAQTNPDIIGFILCGSRGKGLTTDRSDYDCVIVVDDAAREDVASRAEQLPEGLDVAVFTLQEFDEYAAWGQPFASCRYDFARLTANVDKTGGRIQRIIEEKSKVPAGVADHFVRVSLDHYINQVYRSIKCHRDGKTVGFFLEANQSVRPLLDVVFAIHDCRLRPYYKYLEWELTQFPLERLPWSGQRFLDLVLSIASNASCESQLEVFLGLEELLRHEGYADVFESWGDDLWIKEYLV